MYRLIGFDKGSESTVNRIPKLLPLLKLKTDLILFNKFRRNELKKEITFGATSLLGSILYLCRPKF